MFKMGLTRLINILEPLARTLKCLESTQSTAANVHLSWLAALASLKQYLDSPKHGLSSAVKRRVIKNVNKRYNQTINKAPSDAYLAVLVLDPSEPAPVHSHTCSVP